MYGFHVYYIEALIVCIIMFLILLYHNAHNLDRQEKQIKFDKSLIAFILYFTADCFWAAITGGVMPKTRPIVLLVLLSLYVFMTAISYTWLEYVMAVEQLPNRNRPLNRFAVLFPFLVSTGALIVNYLLAPQMLINDQLDSTSVYSIYLLATPVIYLIAILFYTLKRACEEDNPVQKRKHLFIGLFPLTTAAGGVVQEVFFPYIPIYCYVDALLLLIFYIQSIEARVSIDPLTKLNNRGQLMRYISQKSNVYQEDRLTVAVMMDINNFKIINDTFGHAEGDHALVIVADALKKVIGQYNMPSFLGRYGGDEFILIIHPEIGSDVDELIRDFRDRVAGEISKYQVQYTLAISAGYAQLDLGNESIQDCIERSDAMLYEDKKRSKVGR